MRYKRKHTRKEIGISAGALQPCSVAVSKMSGLPMRETMIRENDWQQLEIANRELVMCLERLRKVRTSGNRDEIQRAETAYFQALQWVYDAAVLAVSDGNRGF